MSKPRMVSRSTIVFVGLLLTKQTLAQAETNQGLNFSFINFSFITNQSLSDYQSHSYRFISNEQVRNFFSKEDRINSYSLSSNLNSFVGLGLNYSIKYSRASFQQDVGWGYVADYPFIYKDKTMAPFVKFFLQDLFFEVGYGVIKGDTEIKETTHSGSGRLLQDDIIQKNSFDGQVRFLSLGFEKQLYKGIYLMIVG